MRRFGKPLHLFIHRYSNELSLILMTVLLAVSVISFRVQFNELQEQADRTKAQTETIEEQLSILEDQEGNRKQAVKKLIIHNEKQTEFLRCLLTALNQEDQVDEAREECRQEHHFDMQSSGANSTSDNHDTTQSSSDNEKTSHSGSQTVEDSSSLKDHPVFDLFPGNMYGRLKE